VLDRFDRCDVSLLARTRGRRASLSAGRNSAPAASFTPASAPGVASASMISSPRGLRAQRQVPTEAKVVWRRDANHAESIGEPWRWARDGLVGKTVAIRSRAVAHGTAAIGRASWHDRLRRRLSTRWSIPRRATRHRPLCRHLDWRYRPIPAHRRAPKLPDDRSRSFAFRIYEAAVRGLRRSAKKEPSIEAKRRSGTWQQPVAWQRKPAGGTRPTGNARHQRSQPRQCGWQRTFNSH